MEILVFILAILFFPITLLDSLLKSTNNKKKTSKKNLDMYHLLDREKELVKKGQYTPSQFEDDPDEMEEDDYYYDDYK